MRRSSLSRISVILSLLTKVGFHWLARSPAALLDKWRQRRLKRKLLKRKEAINIMWRIHNAMWQIHNARSIVQSLVQVILATFALHATAAQTENIIELSLGSDGRPVVAYEMAEGLLSAPLFDDSLEAGSVARSQWDRRAGCGKVNTSAIVRSTLGCQKVEFVLNWTGKKDRVYPSVIRLMNGGALVFTKYLQLKERRTRWRIHPPTGGIAVFRGKKSSTLLELTAEEVGLEDARGWIYLGPDQIRITKEANVLIDRGVPRSVESEVELITNRVLGLLNRKLGPTKSSPLLFVTWENRSGAGKSFQADVVPGGTVRISLSGGGWLREDKEADPKLLRQVLAHEFIHLWNASEAQPIENSPPWLHEGSAELLSVAALFVTGLVTKEETAQRTNTSLNRCVMYPGYKNLLGLNDDQGQAPYECGFAMYFTMLATLQGSRTSADAFSFFRGFFARYRRYRKEDLLEYFGDQTGKRVDPTMEEILSGVNDPVRRSLGDAGFMIEAVKDIPPALHESIAMHAFAAVMKADCHGEVSFWSDSQALTVAETSKCREIPSDVRIWGTAGVSFLKDSLSAVEKMKSQCNEGGTLQLNAFDRETFGVACTRSVREVLAQVSDVWQLPTPQIAAILEGRGLLTKAGP